MRTIQHVADMQRVALRLRREGKRIGFVPTMGFLHEGHLSLIRAAKEMSDVMVVSIFVNPIQFGPGEDFGRYPRAPRKDSRLCRDAGTDILFVPDASGMYAPDHSVYVEETRLSKGLCGASRAGHFRGVATIVAKLFNIVQPDVAVFGQKDAQQARVIQQMARDLSFPVQIVVAPTVREAGGLAMSSRNAYLSAGERQQAERISRALKLAVSMAGDGTRETLTIKRKMREVIGETRSIGIEYIETVDLQTLEPVRKVERKTLVAVAVRIGKTRLIDNTVIDPARDGS
jgi:pantoate--beta-alanine ligase